MDPHLAPLWGAASSDQLPPRVSSGSSSPDGTVQGVQSGGGGKAKKDNKDQGKKNHGKKDKGKKDKGKKGKKDDDDDIPDQENVPLSDGDDDDDHEEDFGLDGLSEILKEDGSKESKKDKSTAKKPAAHVTKKRPASKKKCEEAFRHWCLLSAKTWHLFLIHLS